MILEEKSIDSIEIDWNRSIIKFIFGNKLLLNLKLLSISVERMFVNNSSRKIANKHIAFLTKSTT